MFDDFENIFTNIFLILRGLFLLEILSDKELFLFLEVSSKVNGRGRHFERLENRQDEDGGRGGGTT
jgi:hypothetical protein